MAFDIGNNSSALAIMRHWQWTRRDPDGVPIAHGLDLRDVVNRLAMQGQSRPQMTILSLLSDGALTAVGDFTWRKYQWGSFFQHEDYTEQIGAHQWQKLQNLINEEKIELAGNGFPYGPVTLEKLGLADCVAYEWQFSENRFSTALCPPDTPTCDTAYFEEWFSAWNLEIRPPPLIADEPPPDANAAPAIISPGRPIAAWWPDFVAELVAYTVEVGLPQGIGHQGQSEVIKDVCARLQERGKEEPSRSQIQEAVNAVLRRMRSAGN